jgi:hypothetical protein
VNILLDMLKDAAVTVDTDRLAYVEGFHETQREWNDEFVLSGVARVSKNTGEHKVGAKRVRTDSHVESKPLVAVAYEVLSDSLGSVPPVVTAYEVLSNRELIIPEDNHDLTLSEETSSGVGMRCFFPNSVDIEDECAREGIILGFGKVTTQVEKDLFFGGL